MNSLKTYQNESQKNHLYKLLNELKGLVGESLEYQAFELLVENCGGLYSPDVVAERLIRRIEMISKRLASKKQVK